MLIYIYLYFLNFLIHINAIFLYHCHKFNIISILDRKQFQPRSKPLNHDDYLGKVKTSVVL